MKLSIVATLCKCGPYVNEFHTRASTVAPSQNVVTARLMTWVDSRKGLHLGGHGYLVTGRSGIYLEKIFSETKQRPYTIVRHIYGRNQG
jgi:hypothetical protein